MTSNQHGMLGIFSTIGWNSTSKVISGRLFTKRASQVQNVCLNLFIHATYLIISCLFCLLQPRAQLSTPATPWVSLIMLYAGKSPCTSSIIPSSVAKPSLQRVLSCAEHILPPWTKHVVQTPARTSRSAELTILQAHYYAKSQPSMPMASGPFNVQHLQTHKSAFHADSR